jgi:hypothetical protein
MFRITQDPSSENDELYLIENTYNGSIVLIMCVVGVSRHVLDLWCVCVCVCVCVCSSQASTTHTHTPQVQNMPPNTDHTRNKRKWTIICIFNQVQFITPWWWILCDTKHVGVYFNVSFLEFYITEMLTSTTVIIVCISWLIKVTGKQTLYKYNTNHLCKANFTFGLISFTSVFIFYEFWDYLGLMEWA